MGVLFRSFLTEMRWFYGPHFLNRELNAEELKRITDKYDELGFPGCPGLVDCMLLNWKNCPRDNKCTYRKMKMGKMPSISCEGSAMAICTAGRGTLSAWGLGSNCDTIIVNTSSLFSIFFQAKGLSIYRWGGTNYAAIFQKDLFIFFPMASTHPGPSSLAQATRLPPRRNYI